MTGGLRRLVTGPAGSGKTHIALARIRDAATAQGERGRHERLGTRALLVVPTYAQVRHAQRIALSRWDARAMLDAPFATFTSAGERFLPSFRVRTLPSAVERDRLMAQALEATTPSVFTRSGDAPGLRARLLRLIKDFKQSGLPGAALRTQVQERLDRLAPNARDRAADFVRVFACYEKLLQDAEFEDHEDVLRRLVESLESASPERTPAVLVFDGFDDFTAIEHRILDALTTHVSAQGGEVLVTLPYDATRPGLFAGSAPTRERLLKNGFQEEGAAPGARFQDSALARIAADLFGRSTGAPQPTQTVRTIIAGDPDDEAECVARAVRALDRHKPREDGAPRGWRQVGIVLRDVARGAPRVQAALERLHVPVRTLHSGVPLATVPWVVALSGPLAVLQGDVAAGSFAGRPIRAWLRWVTTAHDDAEARLQLDAWDIHHRTEGELPTWSAFVAAAPEALRASLERLEALREALAQQQAGVALYRALADALPTLVPLPRGGGLRASGQIQDEAADHRRQHAAHAQRRVIDMLQGLAASAAREAATSLTPEQAIRNLEATWLDATLAVPDRRLDAVNLLDPATARYWELDHVFVVGLAEGAFPVRPREDVLLRDADRDVLCGDGEGLQLPRARDRETRERRMFYGAVTRARVGLWLTRPAYDRGGEPLQASVYWDLVHQLVQPTLEYESEGPGQSTWPERWSFTAADVVRLGAVHRRERTDEAFAQAALADSDVWRRATRHFLRAPAELTSPDIQSRFRRTVEVVSPSALNQVVQCPHRHFLGRVLNVRPDNLSFEPRGLGFREQGQALHDAFHDAIGEPDRSADSIAATRAAQFEAEPAARAMLERELARAIELLRLREIDTAGPFVPDPALLEREFGRRAPLWLGEDAQRFRLKGRVDRVDVRVTPDGSRAILVDYKRSKTSVTRSYSGTEKATDLQLPLYARALEVLTGMQVVGLEWIAGIVRDRRTIASESEAARLASRREGVKPVIESDTDFRSRLDDAEQVAAQAVQTVRSGDHARRPANVSLCATCNWLSICRPDRAWLARSEDA